MAQPLSGTAVVAGEATTSGSATMGLGPIAKSADAQKEIATTPTSNQRALASILGGKARKLKEAEEKTKKLEDELAKLKASANGAPAQGGNVGGDDAPDPAMDRRIAGLRAQITTLKGLDAVDCVPGRLAEYETRLTEAVKAKDASKPPSVRLASARNALARNQKALDKAMAAKSASEKVLAESQDALRKSTEEVVSAQEAVGQSKAEFAAASQLVGNQPDAAGTNGQLPALLGSFQHIEQALAMATALFPQHAGQGSTALETLRGLFNQSAAVSAAQAGAAPPGFLAAAGITVLPTPEMQAAAATIEEQRRVLQQQQVQQQQAAAVLQNQQQVWEQQNAALQQQQKAHAEQQWSFAQQKQPQQPLAAEGGAPLVEPAADKNSAEADVVGGEADGQSSMDDGNAEAVLQELEELLASDEEEETESQKLEPFKAKILEKVTKLKGVKASHAVKGVRKAIA